MTLRVPRAAEERSQSRRERRPALGLPPVEQRLDLGPAADLVPRRIVQELDVEAVRVVHHQQHVREFLERVAQLRPPRTARHIVRDGAHRAAVVGDDEYERLLKEVFDATSKLLGRAPTAHRGPESEEGWKLAGFQATAPDREFRGGGLLGLHCLLHALEHHPATCAKLLEGPFPFAAASINMTLVAARLAGDKDDDLDPTLVAKQQVPALKCLSCDRPLTLAPRTEAGIFPPAAYAGAAPAKVESLGRGPTPLDALYAAGARPRSRANKGQAAVLRERVSHVIKVSIYWPNVIPSGRAAPCMRRGSIRRSYTGC